MDTNTKDFLQALADKFGVTVDKVYAVMVKQVKLDAVINVITEFIILVLLFILWYLWKLLIPHCVVVSDDEWASWVELCFGGLFLVSLISLIAFIYMLFECVRVGITAIKNPEAEAIRNIIELKK